MARDSRNWFRVHTEIQNSEMRNLADAIASRIGDSAWASPELEEVALRLQRTAEEYTEALYRELPEAHHLIQNGVRVVQKYEHGPRGRLGGEGDW